VTIRECETSTEMNLFTWVK